MTELALRGVIEGFYGEPWSHDERLRLVAELGTWGMNRYVYAPKDDARHRARWREPYPDDEAGRLGELASAARAAGVEFTYALHPGLDIVHADERDQAAIAAKLRALHALGIRRFALLFDDIEYGLTDPRDLATWGEGAAGSGRAHGATCARTEAEVLAPLGLAGTLLMVPTDYAGSGPSEYRDGLDATLGADTGVMWTGDDIVVGEVTSAHIRGAASAFGGRPLVLWDNFPVNDFEPSRAFLGPLTGRAADAPAAGLHGILANPMVQFEPGRFGMRTVAEWAVDPAGYDPAAAAERALHDVAGEDAESLRPLVAAASSWPPSRPQHPELVAAIDAAFDGSGDALDRMLSELRGLGDIPIGTPLTRALHPWAVAGGLTADVVSAALALSRGQGAADAVEAAWESARTARHGLARDAARAAAERALGRPLTDPAKPTTGVPEDQLGG
jgi:hyaluronoglucosaminidase